MGITMEMLGVIRMEKPAGAVPAGLKIASFARPDSFDAVPSPVLTVGSFTLWPFSYLDNRESFGLAMYDPEWKLTGRIEKPGARYVCNVELEGAGETGTITFRGQANHTVVMKPGELEPLML